MVLFILFPGHGQTDKFWEYKIIEEKNKKYKLKKLDFLKKLKKIGKVYKYTPNAYNLNYYYTGASKGFEDWQEIYQNLFKKPKKITLDNINIDKECKRIYNLLKDKNEKFVPIGHSIGSWYALHFSNLYPSKCLKTIFLDGSDIINIYYQKKRADKIKSNEISNENLDSLFNKIIQNIQKDRFKHNKKINKYIEEIEGITGAYYYHTMKKELNGKIKVPVISFRNLNFDIDKGKNKKDRNDENMRRIKNEEKLYNINGNKITTYYLMNSGHFPWRIQRYSDQIIDEIKKILK
jgi:pimeloyl-ACP methyl ester carboxylesterase